MTMHNSPADAAADPATLSYEQARDQLVYIVGQLESGQAPLDVTMSLWERGQALAMRCRSILDAAEQRVAEASAQASSEGNAE